MKFILKSIHIMIEKDKISAIQPITFKSYETR